MDIILEANKYEVLHKEPHNNTIKLESTDLEKATFILDGVSKDFDDIISYYARYAITEAYNDGVEDGKLDSSDRYDTYQDGWEDGYAKGFAEGRDEGMEQGYEDGISINMEEDFSD